MANENRTELAVIGGGPGGYAAAFLGAEKGMNVTLVDPGENPGGVCLYRGCIPSKALLHVAKVINEASEAESWGVKFAEPEIDIKKVISWKDDVVEKLTGGLGQLAKRRNVNHVRGTAKFKNNSTLDIKTVGGKNQTLKFDHAIIATGSLPTVIPSLAIDSDRILDSTSALALKKIPGSLLVVGGGYIGLELGTVFATMGTKVTVVEMTDGILPGVDRDLVSPLNKRLTGLFESIQLNTTVKSLKVRKNGIQAELAGGETDGSHVFDYILVSVGRRPHTKDLGLENTAVEVNERGFIKCDDQRRTAEKNIFAIGDVAGEPMLAHKATAEGRLAVEVIAGSKAIFEPYAIPAVVFTDPEIAWCGLTQNEAKKQEIKFEAVRYPWGASGRALTLGRSDGVTKLIVNPDTERVLGVGVSGPGAGELIAEAVLAIEMGATVADIGLTIHPHPTLSETIMEAADVYHGTSTHFYRPKKK